MKKNVLKWAFYAHFTLFLFLDSTKAPLNDSLLKRLCIYSIPGLGATTVFIFSLKQAVLAPIPFSLSRLSSDWLSVTKKLCSNNTFFFKKQVGKAALCHLDPLV